MQSKAATVDAYMAELPEDRRAALSVLREVMRKNIDPVIVECMGYGMPGFAIPHSVYPAGYHCDPKQPLPFAGMASQKQHMSLYLMCVYGNGEREAFLRKRFAESGKKLDMGKSCIRFKRIEDLDLDAIAEVLRSVTAEKFIAWYEAEFKKSAMRKPEGTRAGAGAKKAGAKKVSAKKAGAKAGASAGARAAKKPVKKAAAKSTTKAGSGKKAAKKKRG